MRQGKYCKYRISACALEPAPHSALRFVVQAFCFSLYETQPAKDMEIGDATSEYCIYKNAESTCRGGNPNGSVSGKYHANACGYEKEDHRVQSMFRECTVSTFTQFRPISEATLIPSVTEETIRALNRQFENEAEAYVIQANGFRNALEAFAAYFAKAKEDRSRAISAPPILYPAPERTQGIQEYPSPSDVPVYPAYYPEIALP